MSGGEHGHGGEAVVDEMHPHRNPETARDLASQPEQKSEHEDESDDYGRVLHMSDCPKEGDQDDGLRGRKNHPCQKRQRLTEIVN